MKILIIQDFLRSGGTERQSILLSNSFAAAGHAATLLTFRPGGALASTLASNVTRLSLQPFDLGLDWFAPRLIATARRIAPEIILCMGRMANCYGTALQRAFPDTVVIGTMRTGKKLPGRFADSLRTVRHVVANSRDARETLINQYAIPAGKISVIHNSLVFPSTRRTPAEAAIQRQSLRTREEANLTTTVMVCVAMFRPEKNQRGLIETVAKLPPTLDWQLWLAGNGPSRAGCEQLVTSLRLGDRVKFLGFLPDPSAIYAAADIAVHASESEALSNFLIEAQANGLPAVVYRAQGMEECFIPNQTGWVIARNDFDGFTATIRRLAAEPAATRTERAEAARKYARETFDPAAQVTAYLELFTRLRG